MKGSPSPSVDAWPVELRRHLNILCLLHMPTLRAFPTAGHVTHHDIIVRAMRLLAVENVHADSVCLWPVRR